MMNDVVAPLAAHWILKEDVSSRREIGIVLVAIGVMVIIYTRHQGVPHVSP